jgi:hypothetical protein
LHASADKRHLGQITKQGNALLRLLLVQASSVAVRYDADLQRTYLTLLRRRGHAKAKVAVARRLLVRLFIMLRDAIDYDEFIRRGYALRRRALHAAPAWSGDGIALTTSLSGSELQSGVSEVVYGPRWPISWLERPSPATVASSATVYDVMRALREWMIDGLPSQSEAAVVEIYRPGARRKAVIGKEEESDRLDSERVLMDEPPRSFDPIPLHQCFGDLAAHFAPGRRVPALGQHCPEKALYPEPRMLPAGI